MRSQLKSHLPLLELSMFLVILVIGWAAYELNRGRQSAEQERQAVQQMQHATNDMQLVFSNLQTVFREEFQKPEVSRMLEDLKLPDAFRMRYEYFGIADGVSRNITQLQSLLTGLAVRIEQADAERERFQRKSVEFKNWIKKQQDRTELEHLRLSSQELKTRIDREHLTSVNGPVRVTKDLATLLDEIDRTCTNYLTSAAFVTSNYWRSGEKERVKDRLQRASGDAWQLTDLAKEARTCGRTIETFLEAQTESEFAVRARKQEEAVKHLLEAQSPSEFASRVGRPTEPNLPAVPGADSQSSLRRVFYALLIVLLALCLFIFIALYRQFIVAPLRTKLDETSALALQQSKLDHFSRLSKELAHEIRNPLTAVNARLYTLQKTLPDGSAESKDARVIQNEMHRLNRIVEDFLKLGSPGEPKLAVMSPESPLKEVQDLLGPELEKESIRLTLDSVADGASFRADPQQLKQVLINLIQNAADSIEHDGTITLRARRGQAELKGKSAEAVFLEVEDTGAGIPHELQDRLFDPFFSTKEKGTGLGLPIAARIIDKHGGTLEFESTPGGRTLFTIALPVYRAD